jgi:hypothetical protein
MTVEQRRKFLLYCTGFSPYTQPNIAARYSLDGAPGDSTWIMDGSNRLVLVADRSGNSAENCLVLNGANNNYPSTTKFILAGVCRLEAKLTPSSWTSGSTQEIATVYTGSGSQRSWNFRITGTGEISFNLSSNGTSVERTITSSTSVPFTTVGYVAGIIDIDNGTVDFETSVDGVIWSALGVRQTYTPLTPLNSSADLILGSQSAGAAVFFSGLIHYFRLWHNGVQVRGFNPTVAAKLATSIPDEVSGTWTINSSGDLGARICGARDLYQGTTGKMAIISTATDGKTIATFDGLNDFMKTPPFPLSQPESVYFVGSQVTWSSGDGLFDGNSASERMLVGQRSGGSSPQIVMYNGSTLSDPNTDLSISDRGVIRAVFNGSSSLLAVNKGSGITSNMGSVNGNGFTVGALYSGANPANITFCEALLAARADDDALQLRIADYLMREWNVS